VSGAGAKNGAERARKPDERERSGAGAGLEKIRRSGSGAVHERAESAAHNPLKPIQLIVMIDIVSLQSISNSNTFFSVLFVSCL